MPAIMSSALTACSGRKALPGWPMSLTDSITTTVLTPGTASTSRSNRASADGPNTASGRSCRTRLPLMPALTTASGAWAAARRSATTSGQRRLASTAEP